MACEYCTRPEWNAPKSWLIDGWTTPEPDNEESCYDVQAGINSDGELEIFVNGDASICEKVAFCPKCGDAVIPAWDESAPKDAEDDPEALPDNSGKDAYPDIIWCGNLAKKETLGGFNGYFPFETYADNLWDAHFEVECPFCGNELLCDDYDGRHEPPHAKFWTKRFCDECGARIIVPTDDDPWYTWGHELENCADVDGWSLFYDEDKKRFHLMNDEHCEGALLSGWQLVRFEDIPKEEQ